MHLLKSGVGLQGRILNCLGQGDQVWLRQPVPVQPEVLDFGRVAGREGPLGVELEEVKQVLGLF